MENIHLNGLKNMLGKKIFIEEGTKIEDINCMGIIVDEAVQTITKNLDILQKEKSNFYPDIKRPIKRIKQAIKLLECYQKFIKQR